MVNFNKFHDSIYAPEIVRSAHTRATSADYPNGDPSFGNFFNLWIGFNAWYSVVTDEPTDWKSIKALGASQRLIDLFSNYRRDNQNFGEIAKGFKQHWPVFDMRGIKRKTELLRLLLDQGRQRSMERLRESKVKRCPQSFDSQTEPDWPDTLDAIYQIRCNLFHGDKGSGLDDQMLVNFAYNVLREFIDGVGLYELQE
jgi:hypothetical protein